MLTLIEGEKEKKSAQKAVEAGLKEVLPNVGVRNIGFPGGNTDRPVYAAGEGELYVAFSKPDANATTPRYWNAFGVFQSGASAQEITVEINIAVDGKSARVAGFFAKDEVGNIYLMHTGRVGGGRKGIGRSAFLTWSMLELMEVHESTGRVRRGIAVAQVGSGQLAEQIGNFTSKVADFKSQASSGAFETPLFRARVDEFESYKPEFSGRKKGSRGVTFDYLTYHGDVVQALFDERTADCTDGEKVYSNRLIDLYVRKHQTITEIYEVKTSTDRQALYTAIGQLKTHSSADLSKTILVLPAEEHVAIDIAAALPKLSIEVRYFKVVKRGRKHTIELIRR